MKNIINKIQEQKPSFQNSVYAPAFSDYNHEITRAFLLEVSKR